MNVRDLKKLEMENLSNGGRAILDAVGPSYEYRNGQKTDKVNGVLKSLRQAHHHGG